MPVDCSPGAAQNGADMVLLNQKLQYDATANFQNSRAADDLANARAWQAINLEAARDHGTLKYLATVGLLQVAQTGSTENENLVKPVPNAVIDDTTAASGGAETVAAAGVATANEAAATALATAVSFFNQGLAALSSVLITAAGGASTPSQTSAKPTTGATS